jgi:hypothetical protein
MSRAAYHRSRPVHQECPQVAVTPLTDAEQARASTVSTKLQRLAALAEEAPEMVFMTLAHYIDIELLREA